VEYGYPYLRPQGWQSAIVTTMADLDELALSMPQAAKKLSEDGRPSYLVHGKLFCLQRGRRPDAIDPQTGGRLDDVLMFRVADLETKELLLADGAGVCCDAAFRRLLGRLGADPGSRPGRSRRAPRFGGRGPAHEGAKASRGVARAPRRAGR
jgi:hypothetical protein